MPPPPGSYVPMVAECLIPPKEVTFMTGALMSVGFTEVTTAVAATPLMAGLWDSKWSLVLVLELAAGVALLVAARGVWLGQLWARLAAVAGAVAYGAGLVLGNGMTNASFSRLAESESWRAKFEGSAYEWFIAAFWCLVVVAAVVCAFRPAFAGFAVQREQWRASGGPPPLPGTLAPRPGAVTAYVVITLAAAAISPVQTIIAAFLPSAIGTGAGTFTAVDGANLVASLLSSGFAVFIALYLWKGRPWAWSHDVVVLVGTVWMTAGVVAFVGKELSAVAGALTAVLVLAITAGIGVLLLLRSVRNWLFRVPLLPLPMYTGWPVWQSPPEDQLPAGPPPAV
ncbi:MAG: hypothetical protein LBR27_00985 [Bifidobacteriaceae bacterium]|nr:hypothetical protein [Bifidobacteriaceae bacterium]